jgi:hypothetical protein
MKYRRYRKRRKFVSKAALARYFGISVMTVMRLGKYNLDNLGSMIELILKLEGRKRKNEFKGSDREVAGEIR